MGRPTRLKDKEKSTKPKVWKRKRSVANLRIDVRMPWAASSAWCSFSCWAFAFPTTRQGCRTPLRTVPPPRGKGQQTGFLMEKVRRVNKKQLYLNLDGKCKCAC